MSIQEIITYYSNGNINEKYTEVDGVCQGKYESWYDNGQKYRECDYVNGFIKL